MNLKEKIISDMVIDRDEKRRQAEGILESLNGHELKPEFQKMNYNQLLLHIRGRMIELELEEQPKENNVPVQQPEEMQVKQKRGYRRSWETTANTRCWGIYMPNNIRGALTKRRLSGKRFKVTIEEIKPASEKGARL